MGQDKLVGSFWNIKIQLQTNNWNEQTWLSNSLCFCPLGLVVKLNFSTSKGAYCLLLSPQFCWHSLKLNLFLQTEAPLLVRPFLEHVTMSELHAIMTGGFATIAGGVLAAYIEFGVSASHLLSASVMSAPAALAISKLMYPETEIPESLNESDIEIPRGWVNWIWRIYMYSHRYWQ